MSDCAFGTNFSLAFKDYEPQMQHRICIDERLLLQRFHHNSISFPMVGLLHLSYPMMPFSERRRLMFLILFSSPFASCYQKAVPFKAE